LNAVSTFTGDTLVTRGTLTLSNTAALASSPNIIVYGPANQLNNAGGTFDASGTLYPAVWTLGSGQTLSGAGTVQGNVSLTGTVAPSDPTATNTIGTLSFVNNDDVSLSGTTLMEISKDGGIANDVIDNQSGIGTITYGGTLIVTLTGTNTLAVDDTFDLFNAFGALQGSFSTIILPAGYGWDTGQLTVDGTIKVTAVGAMPTLGSITPTGPTSFQLLGTGTSNALYNVYGADSLTPPVVWDVIGTTTASGLGVLDFTDTQATNAEGYYRFGY